MIQLDGSPLTLEQLKLIASGAPVALTNSAIQAMRLSREVVEKIIAEGRVVYGVNTGFGKLSDVHIPLDRLEQLQLNLVRSHCCGFGDPLNERETRVLMALRINVLSKGFSGARPDVAEALAEHLNAGVLPVVPRKGSVGASGDLAPLAHMALSLIGEGEAWFKGERISSADALARAGVKSIQLAAKEGLALLNGTQAITAVGGLALWDALKLVRATTFGGAMTTEALLGTPVAFDPRIHFARGQAGQIEIAERLCQLFEGSEIRASHLTGDSRVQDPYCLRCMPQVHGAVLDTLRFAQAVLERETGAATDNPLVFAEEGDVLSGGNFHGSPVAVALDCAAISVVHLMGIIERRIDRLINPDVNEHLPPFLAQDPGMESGYMMLHVAAVAALNEARVLAHPATCDNTPTSGAKEDHVSMGMTAANKFREIVDLAAFVTAVEWAIAAQGVECRLPLRPGDRIGALITAIRASGVKPLTADRVLGPETDLLGRRVLEGHFDSELD